MNLVEERAERDGIPVLLTTPFELLHVAAGHPTMFRTTDGTEVLIRLYTPEELIDAQIAAARAGTPEGQEPFPPAPTYDEAARMVAPLPI
jgi:hypothetical protein